MTKVDEYIRKGRLKRSSVSTDMILKEFEIGKRDLETAEITYKQGNYKWATIQAYYSIFHDFRALLFAAGLREESHTALKYAIHELYVLPGQMSDEAYQTFERGMDLREMADYKETFSETSAQILIEKIKRAEDEIDFLPRCDTGSRCVYSVSSMVEPFLIRSMNASIRLVASRDAVSR